MLHILIILIIHDTLHLHANRSQVMVYHYSKLIVSIIDNSDWLCVRINDSKPWQRWMNFKTCLAFCCISFHDVDFQSMFPTSYFDQKHVRFFVNIYSFAYLNCNLLFFNHWLVESDILKNRLTIFPIISFTSRFNYIPFQFFYKNFQFLISQTVQQDCIIIKYIV